MIAIKLACMQRVDDVIHLEHCSRTVILKKYVILDEFKRKLLK